MFRTMYMKQRFSFFLPIILLVLTASLYGCAMVPGGGGSVSWTEAVKLNDGRVIVVERQQTLGKKPTISSRERIIEHEKWIIPFPDRVSPLVWETGYCNPPKCKNLMPILIGRVDGVPYLATRPAGCLAYNYWGRPNPPYVFLKYSNDNWKRIDLSSFPEELQEANVVVGRPDTKNRSGHLSLEDIKKENQSLDIYYRQVVRQPMKGGWPGCGEMIYDGRGGWIGLGWFRDKPSLDACNKYCERKQIGQNYCPCETLFKEDK